MAESQVPQDWTGLDDAELQAKLEESIAEFDSLSGAESITKESMDQMRELTTRIQAIRDEQSERTAAAEAAQAEIEQMSQLVRGQQEEQAETSEEEQENSEGDDGEGDDEQSAEAVAEEPAAEEVAIAAAANRRPLNLAAVRARQKRVEPPKEKSVRRVTITAAADVPGIDTGADIDMDQLSDAVGARARAIKTKGGKRNTALVASYRLPFTPELVVNNDGNVAEGTRALVAAADQGRLPGGNLVASGGWCSPSETVYDIAEVACPEALWSPAEIQLRRGGLRYVPTPMLVVDDLTWEWTEQDDIDAADDPDVNKPCFKVPCPDFVDVRCTAIGACVESGLLTDRAFPELTQWYTRNAMVAHEIALKARMYIAAINSSITRNVTVAETMAAFTAVFAAVAFQASDMVEKLNLCDNIALELVLPWWFRNAALVDIARQNGRSLDEVDASVIDRAFGRIGVSVQWARGLAPDVPSRIGGADTLLDGWPASMGFLLYPAGGFQIGRGDTVDLGVVQDSNKFKTNDYTALFTEECVALVARGPEARYVTVPICPDGTTGGQATSDVDIDCPLENGTEGS